MASWTRSGSYSAPRNFIQRAIRLAGRILVSLGLIVAITFLSSRLVPVNEITAGFLYLVAILFIATASGLVESTIASIAAMLCFNYYFLPPVGTLTISDPRNWVALFAFLATSLTASQLSARAKRQTREVIDSQNEIERLYSLSRTLLLTDATRPIAKQIVERIAQTFESPAVALYIRRTGEIFRAGFDNCSADRKASEQIQVQRFRKTVSGGVCDRGSPSVLRSSWRP